MYKYWLGRFGLSSVVPELVDRAAQRHMIAAAATLHGSPHPHRDASRPRAVCMPPVALCPQIYDGVAPPYPLPALVAEAAKRRRLRRPIYSSLRGAVRFLELRYSRRRYLHTESRQ